MIDNQSDYRHAWFCKRGPAAQDFDVLVARASYRIDPARHALDRLPDATVQPGDLLSGDPVRAPLASVMEREGDLLLFKPATDIHVTGTALAAEGRPTSGWRAGLRIGTCEKVVQLWGPRRFRIQLLGWRTTEPEPVTQVPLSYRLAFGGHFIAEADPSAPLVKADNPAGCGWLPTAKRMRDLQKRARAELEARVFGISELPAPQIEDPRMPVRSPECDIPTVGLGPIARWWAPRKDHLGSRDAGWRAQRYPAYPENFDPAFFQSAATGLVASPYLKGGEPVVLAGLFAEGPVRLTLPEARPTAVVVREDASAQITPLVLDTVHFDLDARQLHLCWRTSFSRRNRVRHVSLVEVPAA